MRRSSRAAAAQDMVAPPRKPPNWWLRGLLVGVWGGGPCLLEAWLAPLASSARLGLLGLGSFVVVVPSLLFPLAARRGRRGRVLINQRLQD
jgi:hypothetical protein